METSEDETTTVQRVRALWFPGSVVKLEVWLRTWYEEVFGVLRTSKVYILVSQSKPLACSPRHAFASFLACSLREVIWW